MRAALTGHLVLSTLHTNSAAATISRLLNMGLESYILSSTIIGIVAQRLVRTICPDCREQVELTSLVVIRYIESLGLEPPKLVYQGRGCPCAEAAAIGAHRGGGGLGVQQGDAPGGGAGGPWRRSFWRSLCAQA